MALYLSASNAEVEFSQIKEKDGLVYKNSSKFTGIFKKRNFKITVNEGKISSLDVYSRDKKIASFSISNNQFNGKSYINHRTLGTQNLFYKNGCIQNIETENYKETFKDCNFKEGITSLNNKYSLSSKYPYVYELDVFSFNINSYIFKKINLENGLVKSRDGKKVYRNSKIQRLIVAVPQAGINYVISLDKNEKVDSILKFYMDSQTSLIAYFKNEELSHIVSFDKDVNLIEKYKGSKVLFRKNLAEPENIDFNLLENLNDLIVKTDAGIFADIIIEK
jgi:hypothetical protein